MPFRPSLPTIILLSGLIGISLSTTVTKDSASKHCEEFECDRNLLALFSRSEVEPPESVEAQRCRSCAQCTSAGYSVCMESRDGSGSECRCAHAVPSGCGFVAESGEKGRTPRLQRWNVCYQSAIRNPPAPMADLEKRDVLVTLSPFWTTNYWRQLKVLNLTLHYEFPVMAPDECDGVITTIRRQSRVERGYLCTPHLKIELDEEETVESEAPPPKPQGKEGEKKDAEEEAANSPPEIQFERDVFDGAPRVRFYYKINVKRDSQLSPKDHKLVERITQLTSDSLTFDLSTGHSDVKAAPTISATLSTARDADASTTMRASPNGRAHAAPTAQHDRLRAESNALLLVSLAAALIAALIILGVVYATRRRRKTAAPIAVVSGGRNPTKRANGHQYTATSQDEKS